MFGYVTICKEHLSAEGMNTFQSYYCGLCREIGKRCSHAARMGLSYDITFLAIVLSALGEDGERHMHRCLVKMGREHECVGNDKAVQYAANMGVILTYLKLLDDWSDEKSIKALFTMPFFYRAVRKAKRRYPDTYCKVREYLDRLSALEKEKCSQIDETADCFAKILEVLFTPDFAEGEKRALSWLGYNIGRWIYIIDAYNDMERDYKSKEYNTFLRANEGKTADEVKSSIRNTLNESLTFTLENASSALNLLEIKRNREVIENIIFVALRLKQNAILGETDESL